MRDIRSDVLACDEVFQPAKILLIFTITAIAAALGCASQSPSNDMVVLKVNHVAEKELMNFEVKVK